MGPKPKFASPESSHRRLLIDAPDQLTPGAIEHSIVEVPMGYLAGAERQA
jgi:hypothetical protein